MTKQIRIMELRGTYKGGGGPDKTILLSAALHEMGKFFVLVTYLRDPKDEDFQITQMAADLDVPDYVEVMDRKIIDFKCIKELNRLIRENNLEIIHVHDTKTTMLGVILKLMNPKVKIMHTAHGWIINSLSERIKQKVQFFLLKFYPFHIAVSKATKKILIDAGIAKERIRVLYNGIDEQKWQRNGIKPTFRKELGIPEDSFVVGTIGRLSAEKDLPTLFEVAKEIISKHPDAFFVVVGEGKGTIRTDFQNMVLEMGLEEKIMFTGHRTDLINIYTSIDLFLMTSLTEGLPNTVLESMSMQVPVVATTVGGVPELVEHGVNGLLCSPGDIDGLALSVETLISDRSSYEEFSKEGRKTIENLFSFRNRTEQIESYYREFAGKI